MALIVERRANQSVILTDSTGRHLATFRLIERKGFRTRVAISAPGDITILRGELATPTMYRCRQCYALRLDAIGGLEMPCECGAFDWEKPAQTFIDKDGNPTR